MEDLKTDGVLRVALGDYANARLEYKNGFGGGSAAGVKIDPVAFIVIKDGITRILPVAVPPTSTMERIVEKVPEIMDKVEKRFDKKQEKDTL